MGPGLCSAYLKHGGDFRGQWWGLLECQQAPLQCWALPDHSGSLQSLLLRTWVCYAGQVMTPLHWALIKLLLWAFLLATTPKDLSRMRYFISKVQICTWNMFKLLFVILLGKNKQNGLFKQKMICTRWRHICNINWILSLKYRNSSTNMACVHPFGSNSPYRTF